MKVDSETFPGAGLQRHVCDNPNCRKPIVIAWTGRDGEYCSNQCLKDTEIQKESNTMTEEAGTATAVEETPKKKAAKGAAKGEAKAKATPKKKATKGATRASGKDSMAAKITALMERKGGCTMVEMRKIAPNSAGSLMFSFKKAGVKVKVTKDEENVRHYSI